MPAAIAATASTPMMTSQTGRSECSSGEGADDVLPEGILLVAALSAVFLSVFATLTTPPDAASGTKALSRRPALWQERQRARAQPLVSFARAAAPSRESALRKRSFSIDADVGRASVESSAGGEDARDGFRVTGACRMRISATAR